MRRKVYLKGQIEKKFGSEFTINSSSFSDVIKCIDCNRPGFKKYLLECHENDIAFAIKAAGKDIEDQDLLSPLKEGDITIAALPAGSKSDGMKIVTAIALIYISTLIGPGRRLRAWRENGCVCGKSNNGCRNKLSYARYTRYACTGSCH